MSKFLFQAAAIGTLLVAPLSAEIWQPEADMIVTGASIITMGKQPRAQAIAIKDGRIIGVGSEVELAPLRGARTRMVDASGKTIIPGMQDSHIHAVGLGRDTQQTADLLRVRSATEMAKTLGDLKTKLKSKPGDWLAGVRWDPSQFKTLFTRWDIDGATGENPAYLNGYRRLALNSAALRVMGVKDDDPATWPQWWLKDPASFTSEDTIYRAPRKLMINGKTEMVNVPTGVFIGSEALKLITVRPPAPTLDEQVESIRLGSYELNKVGITSIIEPGSGFGAVTRAYQTARDRGALSVRVVSYEGTYYQQPADWIDKHLDEFKISNMGDSWVRLRGVKVYADGGPSSRGSWVSEPFLGGEPGDQHDHGVPLVADYAQREAQFRAIVKHGWELHTHSTGDAAMLQDVRLYKKIQDELLAKRPNADMRWSIEHANLPLEQPEVIETMAKYRIIASIQPGMISDLGHAWSLTLGKERLWRSIPAASYLKHGVLVVSGSDYYHTSYDPWLGVYSLVTRKDSNTGEVYGPAERISLMEALRTYTINSAYAAYAEKERGSLDVGKLADFVVLDLPDLSLAEKDPTIIRTMSSRVLATIVEGRTRYQKAGVTLFPDTSQ